MYAILAEDTNDVECLKVLIKRLKNNKSVKIKSKGFGGCSKMLRDGWKTLKLFDKSGCSQFIICYDRDKETVQQRHEEVVRQIIKPSGIKKDKLICILIPIEEIEAWILADVQAVSSVIPSWRPTEKFPNPESVINPKGKLTQLSQTKKAKPLYIYTVHNQKILQYIDLGIVKKKCPSFKVLADFIENRTPNYPKK